MSNTLTAALSAMYRHVHPRDSQQPLSAKVTHPHPTGNLHEVLRAHQKILCLILAFLFHPRHTVSAFCTILDRRPTPQD